LNLTGTPGREYILQSSTTLVDWSDTLTDAVSYDGSLTLEIAPTTDPVRFFRAMAR
jgi:hypothetical protein